MSPCATAHAIVCRAGSARFTRSVGDAGAVAWFSVEPLEKGDDGSFMLSVDRFDGRDAIVVLGNERVAGPIRPDASLNCAEPGELSATPVDAPTRSALVRLNADIEVIAVECLYSE